MTAEHAGTRTVYRGNKRNHYRSSRQANTRVDAGTEIDRNIYILILYIDIYRIGYIERPPMETHNGTFCDYNYKPLINPKIPYKSWAFLTAVC